MWYYNIGFIIIIIGIKYPYGMNLNIILEGLKVVSKVILFLFDDM
jgi:hypothetical protein